MQKVCGTCKYLGDKNEFGGRCMATSNFRHTQDKACNYYASKDGWKGPKQPHDTIELNQ